MKINWHSENMPNMHVNEKEGVTFLTYPAFEEMPEIVHGFSTRLGGVSEGIYSSMNLSFTRGDKEKEGVTFLTYPAFEEMPEIVHGFSTRLGGVSEGIYSSMNLSFTRGDKEEAVKENYRRISSAMGFAMENIVTSDQTHTANVRRVTEEDRGNGITKPRPYKDVDGMITDVPGIAMENIVTSDQTHTANVRRVTEEDRGNGITKPRPYKDVDGMITDVPGIVLATFYADCVPLYFVDPVQKAIGLSHSGWRGTVSKIGKITVEKMSEEYGTRPYADCVPLYFVDPVQKAIGLSHSGWRGTVSKIGKITVEKMSEEYGTRPEELYAAVGPSICQKCYEVSEDVAEEFRRAFDPKYWNALFYKKENGKYQLNLWEANPSICQKCYEVSEDVAEEFRRAFDPKYWNALFYKKENGKYQLNLWEANRIVLLESGIPEDHISMPNLCTCCNPEFLFSHRASKGKRGNLGAFLGIRIVLLESGIPEDHISMPNLCTCCNPEFLFSHRASKGKRGNLGAFLGIRRN